MPYIGHNPTNAGSFIELDDFGSSFDGSETQFTLQVGSVDITPNAQNLLIMIDGVVQQPTNAYSVSGSTITFTEAPPSGADFYGVLMGQSASVGQGTVGADELAITGNGTSNQILISDGDGTFSWSTDLAGNSGTATALATARAINGVDFDGSAAITVTAAAGTLSGTELKSTVVTSSLESVGTLNALTGGTGDFNWDSNTLVVDSSASRVGIGTASPDRTLEISGSEPYLRMYDTAASKHFEWWLASGGGVSSLRLASEATSNNLVISNNGRVGIGTSAADGTLHVHTATAGSVTAHANADELVVEGSGATGISILTADNQTGALMFGCPSDTQSARITNTQSTGIFLVSSAQTNGQMVFESGAGVEAMRIDENQKIGIGTASPDVKLHIDSGTNNNVAYFVSSDRYAHINIADSGTTHDVLLGADNGAFFLNTGNVHGRVAVDTDGNVGIGTTAPEGILEIGDVSESSGGCLFKQMTVTGETATTFYTTPGSGEWGGIVELTWISSGDVNRTGYQLSRFHYDEAFTSLVNDSQNASMTLSMSNNNMQMTITGSGITYRVMIRIMGGEEA